MALEIRKVLNNPQLYRQKVSALRLLKEKVSIKHEEQLLLNAILKA